MLPLMGNEQVDAVTRELARVGIKPTLERLGSGHVKIVWSVLDKRYELVVAATASDWRAPLNARAVARKSIRNYQPIKTVVKPHSSTPEALLSLQQDITTLQAEVSVLIDVVLDSLLVTTNIDRSIPVRKRGGEGSAGQARVLEVLTFKEPKKPAEIAKEINSKNTNVSASLTHLQKKGLVERVIGGWRRKRETGG